MSSNSSRPHTSTLYPVHTIVYRGYEAAVRAAAKKEMARSRSRSSSVFRSVPTAAKEGDKVDVSIEQEEADVKKRDSSEFRGRKPEARHSHSPSVGGIVNDDGDITDLILIIHGIGQGVSQILNFRLPIRS